MPVYGVQCDFCEERVMVVVTMVGGFALWFLVRPFLSEKRGTFAIACFFACFALALAIDFWLSQDFVRSFAERIIEIWSR